MSELKLPMRPREKVEVVYVPNENIENIITVNKKNGPDYNNSVETPKSKKATRIVTRSGRQVTSTTISYTPSSTCGDDVEDSESSDDSETDSKTDCDKPTALFEDEMVSGDKIFGFASPRRKDGMLAKAQDSASKFTTTPSTPKQIRLQTSENTPAIVRNRFKNKLSKRVIQIRDDVVTDDSDSDFKMSDESESSSSSEEEGISPLDKIVVNKKVVSNVPKSKTPVSRSKRGDDPDYVFTSQEYFESHSGKAITSNRTLGKLKTPRLGQDQLGEILKSVKSNHEDYIKALCEDNASYFQKWLFYFKEGFNIITYGLGSKRNVITQFQMEYLSNSLVLVVNGYFPGLTLKEITDSLGQLLGMKHVPSQPNELVEAVRLKLEPRSASRVFMLIHNIDGPMLRNEKIQHCLSLLGKLPKIHILASLDHINAPILWNQNKLSNFNFVWEDCTTFLPYKDETSFESSLMVQKSETLALAALKNVFLSLNTNSRKIYMLLVNHKLESKNKLGMPFSELYRECRDNFIVSSDLALRSQLTEFLEHQMLKWKKDTDHLIVPVDVNILKQFCNEVVSEE